MRDTKLNETVSTSLPRKPSNRAKAASDGGVRLNNYRSDKEVTIPMQCILRKLMLLPLLLLLTACGGGGGGGGNGGGATSTCVWGSSNWGACSWGS